MPPRPPPPPPPAAAARCRRIRRGRFTCSAAAPAARRTTFRRGAAARARDHPCFHLRVNRRRLGAEHRYRNPPVNAVFGLRPARPLELRPRVAAVRRLPQRAARTAAVVSPPRAPVLVGRRVQDLGIHGIDRHVREARVRVDVLRLLPVLPAVGGLVEAAFRIGPEQVAVGRHVDHIRIGRVHHDARNRLRIVQAQVVPVLASVRSAPDAVADGRALPVVRLARAHVDHVRIGGSDPDGPHRFVLHVVELRVPVIAAIGRLPQPAGSVSDIDDHGILLGARNVVHASHHRRRADRAELEPPQ